jgi:hypothetical protein
MRRIRQRLTFANVVSVIALFVALSGGTAVALTGSNTVQSDDLGPGAQVKGADVAAGAVGSAAVANGQLNDEDIAQATFVNFTGAIGLLGAHVCVERKVTGVNVQGDHLLLTPDFATQHGDLVYSAETVNGGGGEMWIQACNPTDSTINDGNTNFNLLVIDAH